MSRPTKRGRLLLDVAFIGAVLFAAAVFSIFSWMVFPNG